MRAGSDWPTAHWSEAIERVRSDRRRGAQALALATLRALRAEIRRWARAPAASQVRASRAIARDLDRAQPAMGIFARWAAEWRRMARDRTTTRRAAWVRHWQRRLTLESDRVAARAARHLPPGRRVLTISRSRTVLAALTHAPPSRRPASVTVLESRPGGEGRAMASDLRRRGVPARWVADHALRRALSEVDLVVIGADAVEPDGAVIHKVGTRALAAAARRAGRPVLVVTGRSKFAPRRIRRLPSRFDRTPARLVARIWTDGPAGRKTSNRPAG